MNDSIVKFLLAALNEDGLDKQTMLVDFSSAFRAVGWGIVRFLAFVADSLYKGIATICNALNFAKSSNIQNLVHQYQPLLYAVLIIAIVGLGFYLIAKKSGTQLSVVQNIVICVLIVGAMPLFTAKMTNLTTAGIDDVLSNKYSINTQTSYKNADESGKKSTEKYGGMSDLVIANNLVDLNAVDQHLDSKKRIWRYSGNSYTGKPRGYINGSTVLNNNWKKIDINTVMDYDEGVFGTSNFKNTDVFRQELVDKSAGVNSELGSLDKKGFADMIQSYYYRWQVISWFNMIAMLAIMVLVLFFACVKCGRIVIEVAQINVWLPFVAASDLAVGQRTKEGIKNFFALFAALFLCIALLGVYFVGFGWVENQNWNTWVKLVMQLALAWATIDGPNAIERIIGIDVGLKSGWQMMMGLQAGGRMATGAVGTVSSVGKTAGKVGKAAGTFAVGKNGMGKVSDKLNSAKKAGEKATGGYGASGAIGNAFKAASNMKNKENGNLNGASKDSGGKVRTTNNFNSSSGSGKDVGKNGKDGRDSTTQSSSSLDQDSVNRYKKNDNLKK